MNDSGKMGGISALIVAVVYILGMALSLTVLMPAGDGAGNTDSLRQVAFLVDHQSAVYLVNVGVYIVSGVFQLILTVVLSQRLRASSPLLAQTASAFGLIWAGVVIASGMVASIGLSTVTELYARDPAQAASVWLGAQIVQNGLGGGTEVVGGLWMALVSGVAWRTGAFPRALNVLGVVTGGAGILSIFPAREVLVAVFGLGSIIWFVWLGVVMLRSRPGAAAQEAAVGHLDGRPAPGVPLS